MFIFAEKNVKMYQRNFWNSIPPVCKNLIIINLIVYFVSFVLNEQKIFDLNGYFGLHYWASEKFNPIQLISYMFLHGSFTHVFFNMFSLFMFAFVLEYHWSGTRFLFYYLFCGVGAGIVQQIFWTIEYQPMLSVFNQAISSGSVEPLLSHQIELSKYFTFSNLEHFTIDQIIEMKYLCLNGPVTIGASGAVFGILLAFGWLFPDQKMFLIFLPIPIPARIFVIGYAVIELFFGVAGFSGDHVAHFAHLGGMLFGWLLILWWKKKGNLNS